MTGNGKWSKKNDIKGEERDEKQRMERTPCQTCQMFVWLPDPLPLLCFALALSGGSLRLAVQPEWLCMMSCWVK